MARIPVALLTVGLLAAQASTAGLHSPSPIRVPGAPVAVVVGAGSVWVLVGSARRGQLLRLRPADGRIQAAIALGRPAFEVGGVAVGAGSVWAVAGSRLFRIDPDRNQVVARIALGALADSVFASRAAIWATRAVGGLGQLIRVDPRSDRVVARLQMGGGPGSVVRALGSIWVVNTSPPSLMRVDPRKNVVKATLLGDAVLSSLAVGRGRLWVAQGDGVVPPVLDGLDARGRIVRRIALPRPVGHLAAAGGDVWASDDCGCPAGRLLRINVSLGRVSVSYRVGETPVAVAIGGGAVWVANFGDSTVSRLPIRANVSAP